MEGRALSLTLDPLMDGSSGVEPVVINRLGQFAGDGVLSTALCENDGRRTGRWVLTRWLEPKTSA